jgi:4'-phosphopantetheinyl transferase
VRNLVPGEVHVWVASLTAADQEQDLSPLRALLDEEERARADRFHFERHRRQFVLSHALVRRALSEYAPVIPEAWRFHKNAHGRPEVGNAAGKGLCFNLSHTDGLALCAVALSAEVGVDVEFERPFADDRLSLARARFHPREVAALETTAPADLCTRFLEIWTLKEAYVKARGLGLSLSLRDFAFTLTSERAPEIHFHAGFEDSRSGWRFFQLRPTSRHRGALAVRGAGHKASSVTQIVVDLLNAPALG